MLFFVSVWICEEYKRHTLRYLGIVVDDGVVDPEGEVKKRSDTRFEWFVSVRGFTQRCAVTLRCGNACQRGVPFPAHWATALRCTGLEQKAHSATCSVRGVTDVTCSVLGLPKPTTVPLAGIMCVPGGVAAVNEWPPAGLLTGSAG